QHAHNIGLAELRHNDHPPERSDGPPRPARLVQAISIRRGPANLETRERACPSAVVWNARKLVEVAAAWRADGKLKARRLEVVENRNEDAARRYLVTDYAGRAVDVVRQEA